MCVCVKRESFMFVYFNKGLYETQNYGKILSLAHFIILGFFCWPLPW